MIRNRVRRALLWGVLVTAVLLGVLVWVVRKGYANEVIRVYLVDELTKQLEEPCRIDAIEGNPLGKYRVLGVHLGSLADIDTIDVHYRMGQLLLGWSVVDSVRLAGVKMRVETENDTVQAAGENWWANPPPLFFEIAHLSLTRGIVVLDSGADLIRNIDFSGAFSANRVGYRITFQHYESVQLHPPLTISNFTGLTVLANGDLHLRDLVLETPKSHVFLSGDVKKLEAPDLDVTFRADSLALSELASVGLTDLPDQQIKVDGRMQGTLSNFSGAVTAESHASFIRADIGYQEGHWTWDGQLRLHAFDPTDWSLQIGLPFVFTVDGITQGAADSTGLLACDFDGQFSQFQYGDVRFDTLQAMVKYDGKRIEGKLEGSGDVGWVSANVLGHIQGADLSGKAEIIMRHLNVAHFPNAPPQIGQVSGKVIVVKDSIWYVDTHLSRAVISEKPYSDVVAIGTYQGQKVDVSHWAVGLPDSMGNVGGKMVVTLRDSSAHILGDISGQFSLAHLFETDLYGTQLHVQGDVDIQGKDLQTLSGQVLATGNIEGFDGGFDSLKVVLQANHLDAIQVDGSLFGSSGRLGVKGVAALDKPVDMAWQLDLVQVDTLFKVFDLPIGGLPIALSGVIKGSWEKPSFSWVGQSDSLFVADVPTRQISSIGKWTSPDSIAVSIKVGDLFWAGRQLKGSFLDATRFDGQIQFLLGSLDGDRDRIYTWGSLTETGDGFRVVIDSLHVQVDQVALYNDGPLKVAYSASTGLQIDQFALSGFAGKIIARDHPDFKSTIEVQLRDLDLRPWAFLMGMPNVDGLLSGDLALSGALSDPLISSELVLKNGHYLGVGISEITGSVSYGQGRVLSELSVQFAQGAPVDVLGSFPIQVKDDQDNRIFLNVRSGEFELPTLDTLLTNMGRVSGVLSIDLAASGTFEKPVISGSISLKDVEVFVKALNQKFQHVTGQLQVDGGQFGVVNLAMGKPDAGAIVTGSFDLKKFDIERWDLSVLATEFEVIGLPELRAVVDGQIDFSGTPKAPKISGGMALKQADIHLTELIETPSSNWEDDPFFNAMDMQLRVSADRQVWIRDPDLQVEISGDVDVIKDAAGLRIYGALNSRRGFYTFQNRRLRIDSGEIQFQGRDMIDPDLDIRTQTEQRLPGDKQPVKIYVNVSGTLTYPEITLTSDPPFEEGDLMAMLVTGRSLNQMGDRQGFDVGDQALNVMLGVAASQLSQRLGNELNLDLFEVDLGGGNVSRIRVGKYFGSRFFVSYAQDISSVGRELGIEFEMGHNVTIEAKQSEEVQTETQNPITKTSLGIFWKREW